MRDPLWMRATPFERRPPSPTRVEFHSCVLGSDFTSPTPFLMHEPLRAAFVSCTFVHHHYAPVVSATRSPREKSRPPPLETDALLGARSFFVSKNATRERDGSERQFFSCQYAPPLFPRAIISSSWAVTSLQGAKLTCFFLPQLQKMCAEITQEGLKKLVQGQNIFYNILRHLRKSAFP